MSKQRKLLFLLMFISGMAIMIANRGKDILDPLSLLGLILVIISAVALRIHVNPPYYPRDLEKRIEKLERESKD